MADETTPVQDDEEVDREPVPAPEEEEKAAPSIVPRETPAIQPIARPQAPAIVPPANTAPPQVARTPLNMIMPGTVPAAPINPAVAPPPPTGAAVAGKAVRDNPFSALMANESAIHHPVARVLHALAQLSPQVREEEEKQREFDAGGPKRDADTREVNARADAAARNADRTMVTDKQGNTYALDQPGLDKYVVGQQANQSKENIAGEGNKTKEDVADKNNQSKFDIQKSKETAAQMLQAGRPVTMDQLAAKATLDNDQATLQKVQQFKEQIAKAGKQEPGSFQAVTNHEGDTLGFVDPKSRDFVPVSAIPGVGEAVGGTSIPLKPSGQTQSRMQQGEAVQRAGDNLVEDIRANRDKIGNVGAIIESAFLGTPLADPKQAYLATEIGSFAALNPAMHGFRGASAMDEFKKLIGGIPNNPDALIASIKAIQRTAGALRPATSSAESQKQGTGGHVIEINGARYRYKGTGDTKDLKNYTKQ